MTATIGSAGIDSGLATVVKTMTKADRDRMTLGLLPANSYLQGPAGDDVDQAPKGKFYVNASRTALDKWRFTVYYKNCEDCAGYIVGVRDDKGILNITSGVEEQEIYKNDIDRAARSMAKKIKKKFTNLTSEQADAYDFLSGNKGQAKDNSIVKEEGTIINNDEVINSNLTKQEKEKPPFNYDSHFLQDITLQIKGRRFRKEYEDLSYPEGIRSNRQDRIRFEQIFSEGKTVGGLLSQGKVFQRRQKRIDGSVTLPIVTGIGDRNQVDWQGATLNPIQAAAGGAAASIFQNIKDGKGIGETFSTAAGSLQEAAARLKSGSVGGDIATAINIYLAQKAVGAQGLLSRATGAILNPNLEMLFGGPSLRNFGFTFKLSPRDAGEATQVRKIIRFFKQGMSVKTSSSNVFLKAPNIFVIRYQTFNTDGDEILHPSLNIIKECALLSCDVQYTPDGTYMTYDDPFRTMTSYQLTLSFGELDPIYDSDYTDLDNDQDQVIGF